MKLTYFQDLHKNESKFTIKEQFENERFYCLSLNRSINDLQISFLNVYYYRNMNKSTDGKYKLYRLKDAVCYEELYFYYFFITIDSIFKIIDKTAILLNDSLSLGLNKQDNNLNMAVIKAMATIQDENTAEINSYLKFMSNYKKLQMHLMKEKYRNKNTHDFTSEIPKYRIKDNQIFFDKSLKIDDTYNDLLDLFKELRKYLKLVDEVVLYSIKMQGSV
ncbi:MAG: hypothetical protein E7159_01190 [Firmicutes bacterium]|nr:hypothetical protein [Bacillota bacterium]